MLLQDLNKPNINTLALVGRAIRAMNENDPRFYKIMQADFSAVYHQIKKIGKIATPLYPSLIDKLIRSNEVIAHYIIYHILTDIIENQSQSLYPYVLKAYNFKSDDDRGYGYQLLMLIIKNKTKQLYPIVEKHVIDANPYVMKQIVEFIIANRISELYDVSEKALDKQQTLVEVTSTIYQDLKNLKRQIQALKAGSAK